LGRGKSPEEDLNKTGQSGLSGSEVLEISSKQRETIESQFKMLYD
jgi:C4-type Zn-finger protein